MCGGECKGGGGGACDGVGHYVHFIFGQITHL